MAIAITEDHQALASTAAEFLQKRQVRRASRDLLEAESEPMPETWDDIINLGWLGLHVPEEYSGSGYGLEELVVVVEELAKAVAPGPFVPCVMASAVLVAAGDDATKKKFLPGLATGSLTGAVALEASVTVSGGTASGQAGPVLGGGLAKVLLIPAGDDVAVVEVGTGVNVSVPPNMDPTRRSAEVTLDQAPVTVLPGARRVLIDLARVILAADAVGVAREATDMGAAYARQRLQFGRVIGTYQAVKHHCANMAVATELATSAVWDAARAAAAGGDQLSYAASVAAVLAADAADLCANLNTQVHGGIGMTWEHDAHLFMRRATTLLSLLEPGR
ncbi:MAG: acyl-CoA dehydrogenase family protein, partial [Acidimicrobiales bacterium]